MWASGKGGKGDKGDKGDPGGVLNLSAYTNLDSEGQALIKAHAYLAVTDGMVFAYNINTGTSKDLQIFVGNTDDPAGAGTLIQSSGAGTGDNTDQSVCALVAAGEYFEFVSNETSNIINWKSFGTLSAPVDQD